MYGWNRDDSSDNYGAHTLRVDLGDIELFYSYETIVAYRDSKDGLVCSKNVWTNTTGKHLNWIAEKKDRVDNSTFNQMLDAAILRHIQ